MNTNLILSTHWQLAPALNEQAVQGIDDIHQCIANILNTLKGTDILRPEFGSDHFQYIDQPEDIALPNMVREITLALKHWENRIQVESVQISGQAPHFELLINWLPVDEVYRALYQTTVRT